MATALSIVLLCLVGHVLVIKAAYQTVIKDLRKSITIGTNARFLVNRDDCLRIVQERAPGLGVKLASDVHGGNYDTNLYSEIVVAVAVVMDTTLSNEIDESTSPVSAHGKVLFVALPVVSKGAVIDLLLATYTDETKHLAIPYYTNLETVTTVDAITITVTDNVDVITIQDGEDEMELRVEHTPDCVDNPEVGRDFDVAIGKDIRMTNYPETFNWGCEMSDFSFCEKLDNAMKGSVEPLVQGNVCTVMTTARSRRCPVVSATINAITGTFVSGLPALVETVPVSAIEGEFIDREHNTGLIFPCIVKPKYRQKTLHEMWHH